jgi:hypothetical protein
VYVCVCIYIDIYICTYICLYLCLLYLHIHIGTTSIGLDYLHKNGYHLTEQISMQVVSLSSSFRKKENNEKIGSYDNNESTDKNTDLRYWSLAVLTLFSMPISRTLEHLYKDLKSENKLLSMIIIKQGTIFLDLLYPFSHAFFRKSLCVLLTHIESRFCDPHVVILLN